VGDTYGVSKGAAVTVVRLPAGTLTDEEIAAGRQYVVRYTSLVDAWSKVLNDVITKNLQGKAVINFSAGLRDTAGRIPLEYDSDIDFYRIVKQVIDANVVVVTASGNNGQFKLANPNLPYDKVCTILPGTGCCTH
jgi:hypothetical protein